MWEIIIMYNKWEYIYNFILSIVYLLVLFPPTFCAPSPHFENVIDVKDVIEPHCKDQNLWCAVVAEKWLINALG